MIHYTKQDIIRLVKEEDVEFIRLQFADVCGTLKNMAVTTGQLNMVLNNKCTFDGAANPYLVLAACLAAGLDGMKRKLELGECGKASAKKQDAIPASLGEAIRAFAADDFVKRLLGEHIFDIYARTKKAEWDDYCRQVTEWEINSYLLRI